MISGCSKWCTSANLHIANGDCGNGDYRHISKCDCKWSKPCRLLGYKFDLFDGLGGIFENPSRMKMVLMYSVRCSIVHKNLRAVTRWGQVVFQSEALSLCLGKLGTMGHLPLYSRLCGCLRNSCGAEPQKKKYAQPVILYLLGYIVAWTCWSLGTETPVKK